MVGATNCIAAARAQSGPDREFAAHGRAAFFRVACGLARPGPPAALEPYRPRCRSYAIGYDDRGT